MNTTLLTGIIGSVILVIGAAWKDGNTNIQPWRVTKNWLFTIGAATMLLYAILGGSMFFIILEILMAFASILMMTNLDERLKTRLIGIAGLILLGYTLYSIEDAKIIFFVLGLLGVSLGYVFKMGSQRRNIALTLGSVLIAIYSYLEADWIFFGLNAFFALFSGYYIFKKNE